MKIHDYAFTHGKVLDIKELGRPVQVLQVPTLEYAKEHNIFDKMFAYEYTELFYQYLEPQIVDSSAIQHQFGLQATVMEEALRSTIEWYRTSRSQQK